MQPQNAKDTKIVIVEDNVEIADIYKRRLEMDGYKVFVAYDGITAMYTIQNELPDIVLLDLMVPAIAGDEVLKRMRASEWGKDIPVHIVSNLNEADAPAGLRDLGITGYTVKATLDVYKLPEIVQSALEQTNNN